MVPIRATKKEIHPPRAQSDDSGKDEDSTMHDATKALDDKPKRKRQSQSMYQARLALSSSSSSLSSPSSPSSEISSILRIAFAPLPLVPWLAHSVHLHRVLLPRH